jgi:hypothetical protein
VTFQYGETSYVLIPERSKVYAGWVEVETSRAAQILSAFKVASRPAARRTGRARLES